MALVKVFDVSLNVVTRRLIEDLNLCDMLVLGCFWRFKAGHNNSNRIGEEAWRLKWYARPSWASEKLFIPTIPAGCMCRPFSISLNTVQLP